MNVDLQAVEHEARQAWHARADLRAEFGDQFEAFLAFKRGEARGAIRIHSAGGVVHGADIRSAILDCPLTFEGGTGRITVALASATRGRVSGYAAIFGSVNRKGVRIRRGAFAAARAPVVMLLGHDHARPIGRWEVLQEDHVGLKVEGSINLALADGRRAFELVQAGDVSGLSVGVTATRDGYKVDKDGVVEFTAADLLEVSIVSVPAEDRARATAVEG